MINGNPVDAVLFDLDGTLLDTAPDMVAALNKLRLEQNQSPLAYEQLRPMVSHGARGLIDTGFGTMLDDNTRADLTARFLDIYAAALAIDTVPFDGVDRVIAMLEDSEIPWGIVTNKPSWLTDPLLVSLGFAANAGCVISGDSLTHRKPHPLPLQHAAALLDIEARSCVYIGDAERDIEAGRRAGMQTLVAGYGYILPQEQPHNWQADGYLNQPLELLDWLGLHNAG